MKSHRSSILSHAAIRKRDENSKPYGFEEGEGFGSIQGKKKKSETHQNLHFG